MKKNSDPDSLFYYKKVAMSENKRSCCIAFCENIEQLVNTRCEACDYKCFAEKHYLCMTCYLSILKSSYLRRVPVTCPLDRSRMVVEEDLMLMIETQCLMDDFFKQMTSTAESLTNIRIRNRANNNPHPLSPRGIDNVREAMGDDNYWTDARSRAGLADERDEPRPWNMEAIPIHTFPVIDVVSEGVDINTNTTIQEIHFRDLDDEAANGFHDPNDNDNDRSRTLFRDDDHN